VDLHFIAFVRTPAADKTSGKYTFWEMDGCRMGPIRRGELDEDEDLLSEKALAFGVRRFMEANRQAALAAGKDEGDLRFSMVALAPSLD